MQQFLTGGRVGSHTLGWGRLPEQVAAKPSCGEKDEKDARWQRALQVKEPGGRTAWYEYVPGRALLDSEGVSLLLGASSPQSWP